MQTSWQSQKTPWPGSMSAVRKHQSSPRAAAMERGSYRYINIQTGDVFSGQLPTSYMTFGVWSIWLRDPLRELSVSLFDFDIHKHTLSLARRAD